MENASKALIMAGAILIAIIILSFSIITFKNFSITAQKMTDMTEEEIKMFNSKITPYLGKQSGTQVNVLIQYVISNNINVVQTGEEDKKIKIKFQYDYTDSSKTNTIEVKRNAYNKLEINYGNGNKRVETGSDKYYKVDATYNTYGLISEINVKK